jgi:hypothetical protein
MWQPVVDKRLFDLPKDEGERQSLVIEFDIQSPPPLPDPDHPPEVALEALKGVVASQPNETGNYWEASVRLARALCINAGIPPDVVARTILTGLPEEMRQPVVDKRLFDLPEDQTELQSLVDEFNIQLPPTPSQLYLFNNLPTREASPCLLAR